MSILPKTKTPPKETFYETTMLCYGAAKAGKSTFCSQADKALFLATEAGLNHLETYQIPITSWDDLLNAAAEIAKGEHDFKTIIIDTVDNAFKFCAEHVNKQNGVQHEGDLSYGKGYALIKNEFHRVLTKLSQLPTGLILVSHAEEREIDSRTGKYTKVTPSLPTAARKLILGMVDIIGFVDFQEHITKEGKTEFKRIIRTKPSKHYEAGDRTGFLPETLPLDYKIFEQALKEALKKNRSGPNAGVNKKPAPETSKKIDKSSDAVRAPQNKIIVNRKVSEKNEKSN